MKKRLLSIVAMALGLFLIAGCVSPGSGGSSEEGGPPEDDHAVADPAPAVLVKFRELLNQQRDVPAAAAYLKDNAARLSPDGVSAAMDEYLQQLEASMEQQNKTLFKALEKYPLERSFPAKYASNLDRLNDLNYLKQESALKEDQDIKKLLLAARTQGLKLIAPEGLLSFTIDYALLLDQLKAGIAPELTHYLSIRAAESNTPALVDAALQIRWDDLVKRIIAIEDFKRIYPDSHYKAPLAELHQRYLASYLLGANNTPAYDYQTKCVKPEVLKSFERTLAAYPDYKLAETVRTYLETLKENDLRVKPS